MKRQLSESETTTMTKCSTTAKASSSQSFQETNIYYVYWIDEFQSKPLEYYKINQRQLRGIIDYLEIFDKLIQCDIAIREKVHNKIFIIVNESLCKDLLMLMHDLIQVHSIYTYKDNHNIDQSYVDTLHTYSKFQEVFDTPNELFMKLSQKVRIYARHTFPEEKNASVVSTPERIERTTGLHSYIEEMNWFTYVYDILEELEPAKNGKEKFIQECRLRYRDTPSILRAVEEFNNNYDSKKAIWWYTHEGFLFRMVNRAMRQHNQNDILLLHFFIHDLACELKFESDQHKDADWMDEHVYRGQLMSIDEIKFIERRVNHTLYVNTFLSATTDLDVAYMFAGVGFNDIQSPLQSVVFDITGQGSGGSSEKSVADIHNLSYNNEENEILFSAAYTFMAENVDYDDEKKFWNVRLGRIIDAYDLRLEFDQRLIKLNILIRIILENTDSSLSNANDNNDSDLLYPTFLEYVLLLLNELHDYKSTNVTFTPINDEENILEANKHVPPFELADILKISNHELSFNYKIPRITAVTLHDCLANAYKHNGKYQLALEHFNKAIALAHGNENVRVTFTRKVNLAQTQKLSGNYAVAWAIFEELDEQELTIQFSYERLYADIALDMPHDLTLTALDKARNCFDYIEYTTAVADLETDGFTISEAYASLGDKYLHIYKESEQAALCYNRNIEIRRSSDPNDTVGYGPNYERLGNAYALSNVDMAIENYKKAIAQYSRHQNFFNIDMAICWCKIGYLSTEHQSEPFNRALTLILTAEDQRHTLKADEIASCLLYLAKSYARQQSFLQMSMNICQTILRLYSPELSDQPGIHRDFDEFIQLFVDLHQKTSERNQSNTFTENELLEMWKSTLPLNDAEIDQILKSIQQKLIHMT